MGHSPAANGAAGPRVRRVGRVEAAARRGLGALWYRFEPHLDHPLGRRLLRVASSMAMAVQYRDRCHVRWSDGLWEYRWPDGVVVSDRPLIFRARPDEFGHETPGSAFTDSTFWGYVPAAGDVVVDVGAGMGCALHVLVDRVGADGCIYAFEAHPKTFRILQRLCERNGWRNVVPIRAAVVEKTGTVTISDDDSSETNDVFRPGGYEVQSCALDDFVAARGIERIDFLAMNIEGAEALAIKGMDRTAPITRHMVIACHDFLDEPAKRTKAAVRDWLVQSGFEVSEHPDPDAAAVRDYLYASR